jgi:hypothetical protein
MQTYTAPLRDMRFLLHELHDSTSLSHLSGLEEVTPDLLDTILEEAAKFICATLLPLNAPGDAEGCHYENGHDEQRTAVGRCPGSWPRRDRISKRCRLRPGAAATFLPQAGALLCAIKAGKASMMSLEDTAF